MYIKWSPQYNNKKIIYEQIATDILKINDKEYDFSNKDILIFNVDNIPEVLEAKRENGILKLILKMNYTNKTVWENPNWYNENYRGIYYENYPYNDEINDINMESIIDE